MKHRLLYGVAALAVVAMILSQMLSGATAVQAAAGAQVQAGRIEVRGVGSVEVKPDQAVISFRLFALAPTAAEAQATNASNLIKLEAVLKALGIESDSLRTRSVNLREEWEYLRDQREFRGYVAEHILAVTLDDLTHVGNVLDRVIEATGAMVQGVEFGLRDRREAEKLALREAYSHAASRAQVLAESGGITLGVPTAIVDESAAVAAMPLAMDQAMFRSVAFEASTPVHAGTIRVEAKVRLEYAY